MSENNDRSINDLLVTLFNSVLDTEARAVITKEFSDITENDMHIIEAVGVEEPRMASEVARRLNVTAGTLTINMNSLEKKGYIVRERSTKDKRVVHVLLTEKGRKAFYHHKEFHNDILRAAVSEFNEEERRVLLECLKKLNYFFTQYQYPGNGEEQ